MSTNTDNTTYWNCRGEMQADADDLRHRLIPDQGHAPTGHGEILRCVSNVYYDLYNNGGENLAHSREEDFRHVRQNVGTVGLEDGSDAIRAVLAIERALDELDDSSYGALPEDEVEEDFLETIDRLLDQEWFVTGLEEMVTATIRYCLNAESAGR